MFAVEKVLTEMVNILLDKGADANARYARGWTALTLATVHSYIGIVRSLLEHGADVTARDRDGNGMTALQYAHMNYYGKVNPAISQLLRNAATGKNGSAPSSESLPPTATSPIPVRDQDKSSNVRTTSYIEQMISFSLSNNNDEILEAKRSLESLPKPEKGNGKAARDLNNKGLQYLQSGQYPEAVRLWVQIFFNDDRSIG